MVSRWLSWAGIAAITMIGGAASAEEDPFVVRSATCAGALTAAMSGAEETQRADPNGLGGAWIILDPARDRVCYNLVFYGIDPPTMAHIHRGRSGVAGPVVVPLFNTPEPRYYRFAAGCVDDVDGALIAELRDHPGEFYVNVHNRAYPDGAIRGQLGCVIERP